MDTPAGVTTPAQVTGRGGGGGGGVDWHAGLWLIPVLGALHLLAAVEAMVFFVPYVANANYEVVARTVADALNIITWSGAGVLAVVLVRRAPRDPADGPPPPLLHGLLCGTLALALLLQILHARIAWASMPIPVPKADATGIVMWITPTGLALACAVGHWRTAATATARAAGGSAHTARLRLIAAMLTATGLTWIAHGVLAELTKTEGVQLHWSRPAGLDQVIEWSAITGLAIAAWFHAHRPRLAVPLLGVAVAGALLFVVIADTTHAVQRFGTPFAPSARSWVYLLQPWVVVVLAAIWLFGTRTLRRADSDEPATAE